jgi:hypothetical protein
MAANGDIRLSGINGAIAIGGALPSPGILVAAKTQWDLSLQRDYYDASAFGDSNKIWRPGLRDTQGTYQGLLDMSGDLLFDAAGQAGKMLYLYGDSNQGATSVSLYEVAHGSGFLDASVTCALTDMIKISGQFRAAANWTFFV